MERVNCDKCKRKMLVATSGNSVRDGPYRCGRKACKKQFKY